MTITNHTVINGHTALDRSANLLHIAAAGNVIEDEGNRDAFVSKA